MSAHEFRDVVKKRIDQALFGDGVESGGISYTVMSGAPQDYATYRDLCGYARALDHVKKWIDEAYAEMHDTGPAEDPFNQP